MVDHSSEPLAVQEDIQTALIHVKQQPNRIPAVCGALTDPVFKAALVPA